MEHPPRQPPIARLIDHTLLKADATPLEIDRLCAEAREHGFASVCVNGSHVQRCASLLTDSSVKICTVIGFPLGANATPAKVYEARHAIENGASEIDMVMNIGALKAGDESFVQRDIAAVAAACHGGGAQLKVILETCLLTDEEKTRAAQICKAAGADFVKTSTGFSNGGATVHDVAILRQAIGPTMGIKASGGVRDRKALEAMVQAGATRVGASASVAIVTEG